MNFMMCNRSPFQPGRWLAALLLGLNCFCTQAKATSDQHWVGTWACGVQLTEPRNLPPSPLANSTLRQFVRVTLGGNRLRVRFSNLFGTNAVVMKSVQVALAAGKGSAGAGEIDVRTARSLAFHGAPDIIIPPGEEAVSDPLDYSLPPLASLAVTVYFSDVSATVLTGHPGSRTTSFIQSGNAVSARTLPAATRTTHWYLLSGVDVLAADSNRVVVILGDSITDGRGSTTDGNDRWPDEFAARLASNPATTGVAVLNMGIGGNGIFGGLGPSGQARFNRDVLQRPGARWLVIFLGVNDIGRGASAAALTNAYAQFVAEAHARNLRVYGATITPFGGNGYFTIPHESARQFVNTWIRTSGTFDAVLDFDAAVRDRITLTNLATAYNTGDGLHLNPAGYRAMADSIDLNLFTP